MILMGKRIRITNKIKFTISLFIIIFAIYSILMFTFNEASGEELEEYKKYVVKKGDTIWKIALINIDTNKDVRELVYDIYDVNNIAGSENIYPGQLLLLPVYKSLP
ncbi:MAG: LysM peptidoglycan-binding domain-containing protein [Eubacteriaceae bacterium]